MRHSRRVAHDQFPKIGLPSVVGKMSSRKKWIWKTKPVALFVLFGPGTSASRPTWKLSPDQMNPGAMVPVALTPLLRVTGNE